VQPYDARRVDPRPAGRDARGRPIYATTATRYAPETPAEITERFPALRGFERLLTQDASLRTWPVLSAASHPSASQVWFGTRGGGVFQIDPLFTRGEQMPYGLLAEGAGAIASGADGVWIGGAGVAGSVRDGLTFVDQAMRTWRWVDGGVNSPFTGARTTGISVFGSLVWVATTRGVVLVDGQSGAVVRRWDALSALPSDVALAVEATRDGAWVGTTRGLVFITDDGRGRGGARAAAVGPVLVDGRSVYALARRGDTLWVASDLGVLVQTPDSAEPRRLRAAQTDSRLSGRVVALATADTLVVVATDQGDVLRINVRTGSVLDGVSLVGSARGGLVSGVAIDSLTIWVASSRGVTIVERATGRQHVLGGERELAGEILGITLTPDAAWIATDAGAVRIERLSDGMVR
jgi:ligand-binding sensor domain-containing protein